MKSCMRANPGCKCSYPDKGIFACEVSGLKSALRNHALFIRPVEEELCHHSRRNGTVQAFGNSGGRSSRKITAPSRTSSHFAVLKSDEVSRAATDPTFLSCAELR